ncbi:hypothetical protein [Salinibacterium sp. ZJ454]|uniref:hypothetical protein n=1 Tax=Salinibacterium sp. ZJ454 TaxID=2708339 RepID=UPI0014235339|nr:hypothetical protein [Salinibacterium sp. ZJ454]
MGGTTSRLRKSGAIGAADAVTLVGVMIVAALLGVAMLAIGVFGVIHASTADVVTLPQPVAAEIAVEPKSGTTTLIEGTYRMADVAVAGLDAAPRALLAVSHGFSTIMYVAVSAAVIVLCIGLLRGRPFMPVIRRTVIATSGALIIGGMLSTGLLGFATMEVADALNRPEFPLMANLDFTAPLVGVALALVALAFSVGEKLQRDTDGLV